MSYNRAATLSIYKQLLKLSFEMPSRTRQIFLRNRIRNEFRKNKAVSKEEYAFLMSLAETQLENLSIQKRHLELLQSEEEHLLIPVDLDKVASKNNFMNGPEPSWVKKKASR